VILHKRVDVDGVSIFYREAGHPGSPRLVLLGGFPASSHQFRNLIPALADRFHVVAPDYPGFGNSDLPDPASFPYTFDGFADIIEGWLEAIGFDSFGLFVQDYGGPVGFRIVSRRPERLEWLVIQNSNAYEVGFTEAWDGLRHALWRERTAEHEDALLPFLSLEGIRRVYTHGHRDPEAISPDNWNMDFRFMERPNARRVQLTPQGGEAYLADLPNAELHRLDSGHFAVEDSLDVIGAGIRSFYDRRVASRVAA
jgi:pimeloyl-ACP methyl ester carboxylesterase